MNVDVLIVAGSGLAQLLTTIYGVVVSVKKKHLRIAVVLGVVGGAGVALTVWGSIRASNTQEHLQAHPNPNGQVYFGLYFGGQTVVQPSELKNSESKSYKELARLIPKELPKILAGQDFTDAEATNICLSVLRLDAKYFKKSVGPPYTVTKLVPLGMGKAEPVVYRH